MKTTQLLFVLCSLFAFVFTVPVMAQDESDDLYFNSKDLKKKREEAKNVTSRPQPSSNQYSTPSLEYPENESQETEGNNKFNDPNYTNKYIEAAKSESKIVQNASTINNHYYYNGQPATSNTSSPTDGWYDNNPYKIRRRAKGSSYHVNPVISWNNWSGVGFGISGSWNSGWNNGFGWNSPYYYGWNNPYSYYGYGYGINSGFGGCWGWGDPYYNNYYGYNSGYLYGNNNWVMANNWGWNIFNPNFYGNYGYGYGNYGYGGGFGYNSYYGWRPAVYIPVTYNAPKVNYGPIHNNSNVTNTNGYAPNGNGNLVRPESSGSYLQRNQNGNHTPSQELVRPRERYSQPQPTNPTPIPPQQNRSRNDYNSAPEGFRGYDNNNGGSNFGNGRSGGISPRFEGGGNSGGGNAPNNGGGGGGGLSRPR